MVFLLAGSMRRSGTFDVSRRSKTLLSIVTPDKLVSLAINRKNVARVGWIFLQLLPEAENMVVHGSGRRVGFVSPDFLEQPVARDDFAAMPGRAGAAHRILCRSARYAAGARGFMHYPKSISTSPKRKFRAAAAGTCRLNRTRMRASNSRIPNGLVT